MRQALLLRLLVFSITHIEERDLHAICHLNLAGSHHSKVTEFQLCKSLKIISDTLGTTPLFVARLLWK